MKPIPKKKIKTTNFGLEITPDALLKHRDYLIVQEFNKLYNKDRTRIDDCIQILVDKYFLMPETICKKVDCTIQKSLANYTNLVELRNKKDILMVKDFNVMFNEDRLRFDFCLSQLAWKYTMMPESIRKKLRRLLKNTGNGRNM